MESIGSLGWILDRCVFTTHTPVPAGHDRFPEALWKRVLGVRASARLAQLGAEDELNLTQIALSRSSIRSTAPGSGTSAIRYQPLG